MKTAISYSTLIIFLLLIATGSLTIMMLSYADYTGFWGFLFFPIAYGGIYLIIRLLPIGIDFNKFIKAAFLIQFIFGCLFLLTIQKSVPGTMDPETFYRPNQATRDYYGEIKAQRESFAHGWSIVVAICLLAPWAFKKLFDLAK
jgi:hypothetical protein